MSKNTVSIEVTRDTGPMGGTREKHPAFGMIRLSRVDGDVVLFGSSVVHHGFIALEIHRCERHSNYSRDHLFEKDTIAEVYMTESQFAQLITTWNQGQGAPCTLNYVRDGKLEMVPGIPRDQEGSDAQRAKDDFKLTAGEYLSEFKKLKKKVSEILEKKSLSKEDKKEIVWAIDMAERLLSSAAPFAVEQFIGLAERATAKAKTEIDAFVGNLIARTGLDAIKSIKLLQDKDDRYMDEGPGFGEGDK